MLGDLRRGLVYRLQYSYHKAKSHLRIQIPVVSGPAPGPQGSELPTEISGIDHIINCARSLSGLAKQDQGVKRMSMLSVNKIK